MGVTTGFVALMAVMLGILALAHCDEQICK